MLQEIVHNANMGFVVVGPKLDVRLWNKWMSQVTGVEAEVAYSRKLQDLLPAFKNPSLRERVEKALREGMSSTLPPHETRDIMPVGPVEILVQPLRSRHHFHALRPINEMLADPLCLIQFKSRLPIVVEPRVSDGGKETAPVETSAARMQLLATVSHQIRTPVNGVLGVADLLAATPLSPEQRKYVDLIARSGQALLGFINEMSELSNIEAGLVRVEPGTTNLPVLARDVMDLFASNSSHKGITARIELAPDLPRHVETDPQKLRQILVSLLSNAFKYTDKGHVILKMHAGEAKGRSILSITVADTGVGIPKDRLGGLFEKLEMDVKGGARHYNRTGIGLYLCRALVDMMGGEIGVESTLSSGTSFRISVPVEVAHGAAAVEGPAMMPVAHVDDNRPWHVLIAEDNPVNQMLFVKALEQHGHKVKVVNNGQEAVTAVQVREPFDIILMDIAMPVMDGLEATSLIRSLVGAHGETPILALTAHAMDGDREKFLDAGMDGYQAKPVDPPALVEVMARVIRAHRARHELGADAFVRQRDGQGNDTTLWPTPSAPGDIAGRPDR